MTHPELALSFSLGGLAVAVVAAAAGLRLLRTRALFEFKLAAAGRDMPYAANFFFVAGARTLHATAGTFGLCQFLELALARGLWSMGVSTVLGYLAAFALGLCGLSMVSLAVIDFQAKVSPRPSLLFQLLGGLAGMGLGGLGGYVVFVYGYFWPPA
ncbi:hypothetical protein EDM80_14815 [bacterium]|nr:MAG: hypothetical protein EDM80_14815 [bacterium]RIK59543.1 MAG: hypothetical protein DCC64_15725 [Planctomycetota bacterium]